MYKLIEEARALLTCQTEGVAWGAVYGPHAGLSARTHIVPLRRSTPNFPFRTEQAREIYALAQDLVVDFPESNAKAIVGKALQISQHPTHDLTPEDMTLLVMAVEYLQNGPPPDVSRTSGVRGERSAYSGSRT